MRGDKPGVVMRPSQANSCNIGLPERGPFFGLIGSWGENLREVV
jgi:hypothetical protein